MTDRESVALTEAVDLAVHLLETGEPGSRTYKTDRDFATVLDQRIEREVKELLAQLTPEIPFLGEETGGVDPSGTYWCLDPIDGTLNFTQGIPMYATSLALVRDGVPVLGQIAMPALGERYEATETLALSGGRPIAPSQTSCLRDAVVSTGDFATGKDAESKNRERLNVIATLANRVQRVRMIGSAATDLAWLAAGRLDAVVLMGGHPWDIAAGVALCRRSGIVMSNAQGAPHTLTSTSLVAHTPSLRFDLVDAGLTGL